MTDPCTATRLPAELQDDPMHWAKAWLERSRGKKQVQRNPNTMIAITVGNDGRPSGRAVLCKDFVADPGYVVFYTNYKSDKARQIEENNNVALSVSLGCAGPPDSHGRDRGALAGRRERRLFRDARLGQPARRLGL